MNRGFTTYYSTGFGAAAKTLYSHKNLFRYYVYWLMELLARITILPGVLFDLIAVRQVKHVRDEAQLNLCASFRAAEKGKSLGTMLLVRVMQFLMLVAVVAIAGILGGCIGLLGSFVASKAGASDTVVQLFLSIPPCVTAGLAAIVTVLYFAPSAYTVDRNEGFGMAGVLTVCFDTMKQRGKLTHFLHHFVSLLVKGLIVGALFGIRYLTTQTDGVATIILIVVAVLLVLAYLVFAPLFTLAARVADYCLMEDISLDPFNRAKHAKAVCISRSVANDRDYGHDKKLLELFDSDGASPDYFAYDSDERRQSASTANENYESFVRKEPVKETPEESAPTFAAEEVAETVAEQTPPESDAAGEPSTPEGEQATAPTSEPSAQAEKKPTKKTRTSASKLKRTTAEKTEQASEPATKNETGDDL